MTPTRLALEAALAADPDDPARHAAYADLLIEEGDPRGEFVRLQLALEDPALPADRREPMQRAADELLHRHEAEWLGPLGWIASVCRPTWRRGWVHAVTMPGGIWRREEWFDTTIGPLADCPTAGLLKSLTVQKPGNPPGGPPESESRPSDPPGEPTNVGEYQVTPRAETYWYTEPPYGDQLVDELLASGLIARLHHLDLSRCDVTDDGALALAASPDVRRLKSLTLDGNLISPVGVAALAEVGVRAGPQFWDAGRGDAYV